MEQNSGSLYDELSKRISGSEKFSLFNQLIQNEILKTTKLEGVQIKELTDKDIQFLIEVASIFACSSLDDYKQLAYSIAILIYTQYQETHNEITKIASLLLIRLGNFPAYSLLQRRIQDPSILDEVPINLQIESAEKSIENKKEISEEILYLTDFQKEILNRLTITNDFSFAAPTSAGKSIKAEYLSSDISGASILAKGGGLICFSLFMGKSVF